MTTQKDAREIPTDKQSSIVVQDASGTISDFPDQVDLVHVNATADVGFDTLDLRAAYVVRRVYISTVNSNDARLDVFLPNLPDDGSINNVPSIHVSPLNKTASRKWGEFGSKVHIINPTDFLHTLTVERARVKVHNVTMLGWLQADRETRLDIEDLERITEFKGAEDPDLPVGTYQITGGYTFPNLKTIGTLIAPSPALTSISSPQFSITNILDMGPGWGHGDNYREPKFLGGILTIGKNLSIHDMRGVDFSFNELKSVGDNIEIHGIEYCSFKFGKLTKLGHLTMYDFKKSVMPGDFLRLEDALSIHLNGIIDT